MKRKIPVFFEPVITTHLPYKTPCIHSDKSAAIIETTKNQMRI